MVDATAAGMLRDLARELAVRDVKLLLVGDIGQVRDVLRETGAAGALGQIFPTVDSAIQSLRTDRQDGSGA